MCNNRKSVIFSIKTNGFELFVHFDFGEAQVRIPVLVDDLHPGEAKKGIS
jgi:hypothetical protein